MDRRDGKGLAELLREVGRLEGLHWIRILYAYPSYFDDALINEIASNPKAGLSHAGLLPCVPVGALVAWDSCLASARLSLPVA